MLELTGDVSGKSVVTITDLLGKTMACFETGTDTYQSFNPGLSQGVYFITITRRECTVVRKMVVER